MNRQTLAVTVATLVLLAVGGLFLYSAPPPGGPGPAGQASADKGKAKTAKAKPAGGGDKVPAAKLIFKRDIPADRPAAPEGAPNVVLVLAATVRKDQTPMYGGSELTMPFLASKAAAGLVFSDALATSPWPKTAQVSVLTGRYPAEVGMVELQPIRDAKRLPESATTLAERLADAGWTTLGATSSHYLNGKYGMRQGFDWYRESQPFGYMMDHRIPAKAVVDAALKGLDVQRQVAPDRPVYLQLGFVDSHKPFKVPPDEFEPFKAAGADAAPYQATLRRQDKGLEHLVQELAKRGLTEENTVFVVVAENGEGLSMPEHHRDQHGLTMYPTSVEIPLVMWGKGVGAGKRVDGLVSQIDVAPTLLGMLGVKGGEPTTGLDLSALLAEGGTSPRDLHYADTLFEKAHRASVWTRERQCQKDYGSSFDEPDTTFVDGCFDRAADKDFTAPKSDDALMARLDAEHQARLDALAKAASGGDAEE